MSKIDIAAENGTILFPNGYAVSPSLTQELFRNGEMSGTAQIQSRGTLPWIHYSFPGGIVIDRNLIVSLCFYDQMLVDIMVSVDMYPPGSKDWSNYSLDVEAAAKQFHDSLLEKILGKATEEIRLPNMNLSPAHECLARPLKWDFPWGTVRSTHDFNGGGTFIMISYGNRRDEATKAYYSTAKI